MPDLGPHAVFIWAAYGVTLVAVAALVMVIIGNDRRQRRLIAELERQGVTRRSAKAVAAKASTAKASTARPAASAKPKPASAKTPRARKPKA
jgi:heme exporter protein D